MRTTLAIVAGAAAVLMTADAAWAQRPSVPEPASVRRPYRGVFTAPPDGDAPQTLLFNASIYGAYDDNVLAALSERDVRSPWLQESGYYQGATAGLDYTFNKSNERMGFRGHAGAMASYYRRDADSRTLPYAQADVVYNTRLTRGLTFVARQSLLYASNYNFTGSQSLVDIDGHDIAAAQNPDLDIFGLEAFRSTSSLSLNQNFGRNFSLSGVFNYRIVDFVDDEEEDAPGSRFHDFHSRSGSVRFKYSRPMTRYAQLELGYGIRVTDQQSHNGEPRTMHNIIAGVNYSRPLSISRRTSFTFGTGSAIARNERIDDPSAGGRTTVRLIGHASLIHELGRTWTAQAGYFRGFRTRDGFENLYLTDSLSASIGGLLTRRWSLSAGADWSLGQAEREGNNDARGNVATVQTQFAVTNYIGLYARYIYYSYRYDEGLLVDDRIPQALDRQGVRVGINTSIPLIR